MTEPAPPRPPYPTEIVTEPFTLDDLVFTPDSKYRIEHATRGETFVGDVLLDVRHAKDGTTGDFWFARKEDANRELTDWRPMRCAAEARAFLVSKNK